MFEVGSPAGKKIGERGIVVTVQDRVNGTTKSLTIRGEDMMTVFDEIHFHFKHLEYIGGKNEETRTNKGREGKNGKCYKKVRRANGGDVIQEELLGI